MYKPRFFKEKEFTRCISPCKLSDLDEAFLYVREAILSALIRVGFRRLGIYPTFIHVDADEDKVSSVWLDQTDVCGGWCRKGRPSLFMFIAPSDLKLKKV